ncbi:serine/threonine protein kinase [Actinoallomurus purpureus]|uniref:serine/threonine-protein kinase n=1 Tax=Actinoallomurus purpureus TaxID=478114 RepID=UPI002092C3C9|nr:serine/threonine-protein kinase [Actinoallomurus purpureus]MCO6010183.1 serine/threonine protein kinase [Actinoallomurus purpureus]
MDEWSLHGYTTLRELGRGGFGRVVLARHEASGTHVAVKYLTAPDERFRAEFRAEAQILRGLDDPYVVRLFEYVEEPQGAAIVMEAIDGVSLRALLSERGTLEPEAALAVLKGSLLGLGAAHDVGVVHRDYKPANVMVESDGQSKLIDFGIALRSGVAGQIVGTPAYMAPEQWAGEPASPSTDVYAATCVFFECVTGRKPYPGDTTEAYRAQHTSGEIPAGQAPPSVRALIYRGLAKHPAGRPPGALEFAEELEIAAAAEYGTQWESNGWRRLAEAAAGLAALFPFAALAAGTAPGAAGHAAGAAAGHGAGAAAGKAGAATGKGALTKILGSNAGVKLGAIATGVVVAGSATTAAIVLTQHKPKKPKPVAARIELASYNQSIAGLDLREARYAHVNGVRNAAVQRKIDQALFAPLDWGIVLMQKQDAQANPPCTKPTILRSQPQIGINGPRLASVQYALPAVYCSPLDYQLPRINVNVDLRTGKALTAADVFRPETLRRDGLATLLNRVSAHVTQPDLHTVCVRSPLLHGDFFQTTPQLPGTRPQPPRISPFFTAGGMVLSWSHAGSECPYYAITLPYTEIRDLLTPQIAAELPG